MPIAHAALNGIEAIVGMKEGQAMSRREVIALIFGLLNTPNVEWGPMQYKFAEALGRVRGAW